MYAYTHTFIRVTHRIQTRDMTHYVYITDNTCAFSSSRAFFSKFAAALLLRFLKIQLYSYHVQEIQYPAVFWEILPCVARKILVSAPSTMLHPRQQHVSKSLSHVSFRICWSDLQVSFHINMSLFARKILVSAISTMLHPRQKWVSASLSQVFFRLYWSDLRVSFHIYWSLFMYVNLFSYMYRSLFICAGLFLYM